MDGWEEIGIPKTPEHDYKRPGDPNIQNPNPNPKLNLATALEIVWLPHTTSHELASKRKTQSFSSNPLL